MQRIICFLILYLPNLLVAQPLESWLQQNSIALTTSKPEGNFEDLKSITKYIGHCQVIGLGETSHGQGSFFEMKHRFFKFAVEALGYRVFALEAGFAECFRINEYILTGKGDAESALRYLNYGVWEIKELKDLVEYMRLYNIEHPQKLKFYGFDCQMSFGAIDYLLSIKDSINFRPNLLEEQLFTQLRRLQQSRNSKDAKAVQPSVLSLVSKLDTMINQSNQLDSNEKAKAKIICRTLVQFCQHEASESPEVRAKFMAENVAHIRDLEGKETKIVLSAHNGHVAKAIHFKEFGYYLRQKFQEQYYAVGFDFNRGSLQGFDFVGEQVLWKAYELKPAQKHSLGDVLLGCQKDLLFLDLRQAKNNQTLPKWFTKIQTCGDILGCYGQRGCNKRYWRINLAESYDAILFFKETERAHRL